MVETNSDKPDDDVLRIEKGVPQSAIRLEKAALRTLRYLDANSLIRESSSARGEAEQPALREL